MKRLASELKIWAHLPTSKFPLAQPFFPIKRRASCSHMRNTSFPAEKSQKHPICVPRDHDTVGLLARLHVEAGEETCLFCLLHLQNCQQ